MQDSDTHSSHAFWSFWICLSFKTLSMYDDF